MTERSEKRWGKCPAGGGSSRTCWWDLTSLSAEKGGVQWLSGAGEARMWLQRCAPLGKGLCYWFLFAGCLCFQPTSASYLLWLSSHFNKHEFICRLGVVTCISGKVSFKRCRLFLYLYNSCFQAVIFLCRFPLSPQTTSSWRRLRKQLQPHLKRVTGKYWLWEMKRIW